MERINMLSKREGKTILISVLGIGFFLLFFLEFPLAIWLKRILWVIGAPAVFFAVAASGSKILQWANVKSRDLIISSALGWTVLGYILFILAALKILYPVIVVSSFLVFSIAGITEWKALLSEVKEIAHIRMNLPEKLLITLSLFLISVKVFLPTLDYDSLSYHLTIPSYYLKHHGFAELSGHILGNFPQMGELFYILPIMGGVFSYPGIIHFGFLALTILGVHYHKKLANPLNNDNTALIVLITTPFVILLGGTAYMEFILAFYITAALWSVVKGEHYLSYLFAGCAFAVKYHGGIVLLPIILLTPSALKSIRKLGKGILLFLLPVIPWLIKNMIVTGDPIFPIGSGVLGNPVAKAYLNHVHSHGLDKIWQWFIFPWYLTFKPLIFGGGQDIFGPAWIIMLVCFLIRPGSNPYSRHYLTFAGIYIVFWLTTGQVSRFLLPAVPIIAVLLTCTNLAPSIKGIILAVGFYNIFLSGWIITQTQPWQVFWGSLSSSRYLEQRYPAWRAYEFLKDNKSSGKVLFWGETRGYYCPLDFVPVSVFDRHPLVEWTNKISSVKELKDTFKRENISYILLNKKELKRFGKGVSFNVLSEAGNERLKSLFSDLKPVYSDRDISLFTLKDD